MRLKQASLVTIMALGLSTCLPSCGCRAAQLSQEASTPYVQRTRRLKKEGLSDSVTNYGEDDTILKQSKKSIQMSASDEIGKEKKQSKKEGVVGHEGTNHGDKKQKQSKKEVQTIVLKSDTGGNSKKEAESDAGETDQGGINQKQSKKGVAASDNEKQSKKGNYKVSGESDKASKKQGKKRVETSSVSGESDKNQKQSKKNVDKGPDESDQGDKEEDTKGVQMSAIYFGNGAHYVDLWCGTPPQRQTVIIDTGSATTTFPCSGCTDCWAGKYHIDNAFEEKNSSTFSVVNCDDCLGECSEGRCIINAKISETSFWSAFKARDRCYLGGPHNVPLVQENATESIDPNHAKELTIDLDFACQTAVGHSFKKQLADGMMGMGDDTRSIWSQLYHAGKIGSNKRFSLCFAPRVQYNRTGTVAGAITLGGSDTRLHHSPMVFAKRQNTEGYYKVHIRKIHLRHGKGGESVRTVDPNATLVTLETNEESLNKGGVIVDTGTTATRFNNVISPQFRASFKELSGGTEFISHGRYPMNEEALKSFPTVLVQLEGEKEINEKMNPDPSQVVGLAGDIDPDHPHDVIIAIPPSRYMELGTEGLYDPRIDDTQESGSVIGAFAISGYDILFDMDRQVIGWAESHCDYETLVSENGYRDVLEGPLYKEVPAYSESDDEDDDDADDEDGESSDSEDEYYLDKKALGAAVRKFRRATDPTYSGYGCYRWEVFLVLSMLVIFERFCIGKLLCKPKPSSPTKYSKLNQESEFDDDPTVYANDQLNNEERVRIDLRRRT